MSERPHACMMIGCESMVRPGRLFCDVDFGRLPDADQWRMIDLYVQEGLSDAYYDAGFAARRTLQLMDAQREKRRQRPA